jgi:hypothetical protein
VFSADLHDWLQDQSNTQLHLENYASPNSWVFSADLHGWLQDQSNTQQHLEIYPSPNSWVFAWLAARSVKHAAVPIPGCSVQICTVGCKISQIRSCIWKSTPVPIPGCLHGWQQDQSNTQQSQFLDVQCGFARLAARSVKYAAAFGKLRDMDQPLYMVVALNTESTIT